MTTPNHQTRAAEIAFNIEQIIGRIRDAEHTYDRDVGSVTLLAVSKTRPASDVMAAIDAGTREFGENYVDEGVQKIAEVTQNLQNEIADSIVWHYIGSIQSNKTGLIASNFGWVHGVDRLRIAERLSRQRPDTLPPLNCCIQVNVDAEASKAGVSVAELDELVCACRELPNIRLRGLMVIPAPREEFVEQRQVFSALRDLMPDLHKLHPSLDTLSMGMTGDMEAAIAEGATIVRVGTAIFGARQKSG